MRYLGIIAMGILAFSCASKKEEEQPIQMQIETQGLVYILQDCDNDGKIDLIRLDSGFSSRTGKLTDKAYVRPDFNEKCSGAYYKIIGEMDTAMQQDIYVMMSKSQDLVDRLK